MFQGNPWAHMEMDLESGQLIECENPLPTPESLYQMVDPDSMVAFLRDDLMLQMRLCLNNEIEDLDRTKVNRLAEILGCEPVREDSLPVDRSQIEVIKNEYAFATTRYIIKKAEAFADENDKKLFILLYSPVVTRQIIASGTRYDQPIVDSLQSGKSPYFDANLAHVKDFACFNLSFEEYMKRYSVGHYNPRGNHFFAFAIKDALIDWLDPRPVTYLDNDQPAIVYDYGYLPEV